MYSSTTREIEALNRLFIHFVVELLMLYEG